MNRDNGIIHNLLILIIILRPDYRRNRSGGRTVTPRTGQPRWTGDHLAGKRYTPLYGERGQSIKGPSYLARWMPRSYAGACCQCFAIARPSTPVHVKRARIEADVRTTPEKTIHKKKPRRFFKMQNA